MTDENRTSEPVAPETAIPAGVIGMGWPFASVPAERVRELMLEQFASIKETLERAGLPLTPEFIRVSLEVAARVESAEQSRLVREFQRNNPPPVISDYPPGPALLAPRKGDAPASSDEASSGGDNVIPLRLSKGDGDARLRELAVRLVLGERLDARERAMVREYIHAWADELTR